ncbi:hypothetical protein ANME2D_02475 [Candidatus Methanoperedens nitroreducens]|uniref:Uncharacterized protein n=1 Tax=Candidatus Methanoperedens nitratireducens TaxID=1392998 RepID=A0A062V3R4_9EURY|nr:hypothetical protein [Candidatus Methanoperedens nitroreducens]KCZ71273.1 hypothetical protein ANME2D_02475 [Candidatus Methanoperedens nitroreducens]MDJ1420301.1 hypothetical protein [Candidatus Methanoperedens sp.]
MFENIAYGGHALGTVVGIILLALLLADEPVFLKTKYLIQKYDKNN